MKYTKLLFVIWVIVGLSIINQRFLSINHGTSVYNDDLNNNNAPIVIDLDNNADINNYQKSIDYNTEQGISNTEGIWEENNISLTETLDSFSPRISLEANYTGGLIEGNIEDGNSIISVPNQGIYNLEGEVANMEVQYLQNSGAETLQSFYSDNAIQAGLSLERITDPRSIEGDNVWKFYSSNIETMTYSLYQENIKIYQNDTTISYNYLLESNSSLQNIINSSLILDLVFDTCRIMVIHWHYTNINPPAIGENTTIPFVVYRLLENSSWDDQWNSYSLNILDFFEQGNPYLPTMLKSIGFYVISPEYSECSMLIDNFQVKSSVSPEDINLKVNGFPVNSISVNSGASEIIADVNETNLNNEIELIWSHNSSFEIRSEYTLNITGVIKIPFNKNIQVFGDSVLSYLITTNQISAEIDQVSITYPETWSLNGSVENFQVQSIENINENQTVLTLLKIGGTTDLICQFDIQNLINRTTFTEFTMFEMINATLEFNQPLDTVPVIVFWSGIEEGSMKGQIDNGNLNLNFPPWVQNGIFDIIFVAIETDYIGYTSTTINLLRLPAQLIVIDQTEIPQFALQEIGINYLDLNSGQAIEEPSIIAYLNNEEIPVEIQENMFKLYLSAFYLEVGESILDMLVTSETHASILKIIKINVTESSFDSTFSYTKIDTLLHYKFDFSITANDFPVGHAPIKVDVETIGTITGITDNLGGYAFEVQLPLNQKEIYINYSVINKYSPIFTEHYIAQFSDLQANIVQDGEVKASSDNITLDYTVQYPENHDRWFVIIKEEMAPILSAYIEAETLRIPVFWDDNIIYWEIETEKSNLNHKLIIETTGPDILTSIEEKNDEIKIHFIIDAKTKSYTNISLIYHLNESYSTSEYLWQLFSSRDEDVSEPYELQVNDLYVLLSNVDIAKGSYLILDLVGVKQSNTNAISSIVVPIVSSSSVLVGAIVTIVKVYNKKKGMILEI